MAGKNSKIVSVAAKRHRLEMAGACALLSVKRVSCRSREVVAYGVGPFPLCLD